jgi:hypothetical protein
MKNEGPLLERLTRHLAECPAEFLAEPRIGGKGDIHVEAVVGDLRLDLGGPRLTASEIPSFTPDSPKARNHMRLALIAAWLLGDEWFRQANQYGGALVPFLANRLPELAGLVDAGLFVTDPDRREELARICLHMLDLRPQGETQAQAADRLKTISSVERARVVRATKAAEERARQVRKAMEEKAAREAAAKVSHE